MSERKRVTCGNHGETPATFACQHVAGGLACGFNPAGGDPDDLWPDALCDFCDEALQAGGGEWTDEFVSQAYVRLLCTHCYETARDLSRGIPDLARGATARLSPMEVSRLLEHSVQEVESTQEASRKRWGLGHLSRWDFDHEDRTLTFSDPGSPAVIADVDLVGSYSTATNTFQWAWATMESNEPLAVAASRLRMFGEARGVPSLTTANWACEEAEGWEMACLACYLLRGEGIYRAPFDHLYWFMVLTNFRTRAH